MRRLMDNDCRNQFGAGLLGLHKFCVERACPEFSAKIAKRTSNIADPNAFEVATDAPIAKRITQLDNEECFLDTAQNRFAVNSEKNNDP